MMVFAAEGFLVCCSLNVVKCLTKTQTNEQCFVIFVELLNKFSEYSRLRFISEKYHFV